MCRSKADGGRLCPCQSSARRSAKYKAKKAAVALGDAPTMGARSVSDTPAGVFPEGMPARESFEKLRAGWDADAAKTVIATVSSLTDEELEGAAGDALVAAYPDMMSAMLSGESKRGLDGVSRRDAVRAAVAVEVGCALGAEADKDADLARAREAVKEAKDVEQEALKERKAAVSRGEEARGAYEAAKERGDYDEAQRLVDDVDALRAASDESYRQWSIALNGVVRANSALADARRDAYMRLLSQVRDMGGGFDAKAVFAPRSSVAGKKIVQGASRLYPSDWNKLFSDPVNNRVKVLMRDGRDVGSALSEYGSYQHVASRDRDGSIASALRMVERGESGQNEETACHEMMHRMERVVPGMVGAEQAFLRYRASDSGHGALYPHFVKRGAPEGYSDSFPRVYAGRVYDTKEPYAFEVMSVGAEHVFYGRNGDLSSAGDVEGKPSSADREYRGFVLGVLASL